MVAEFKIQLGRLLDKYCLNERRWLLSIMACNRERIANWILYQFLPAAQQFMADVHLTCGWRLSELRTEMTFKLATTKPGIYLKEGYLLEDVGGQVEVHANVRRRGGWGRSKMAYIGQDGDSLG